MVHAESDWVLVPVPRLRLWLRGFNQAALLAHEIARIKGMRLEVVGLLRTRSTPMLGGLCSKARSIAGAIAVNPKPAERLYGDSVMLVDNLLTSAARPAAPA